MTSATISCYTHCTGILVCVLVILSNIVALVGTSEQTPASDSVVPNVYTQESIHELNSVLGTRKDLQMIFITVEHEETKEILAHLWLVVYYSLLFVKPYARFYTMYTIDQKFEYITLQSTVRDFHSFNVTARGMNHLSKWARAFYNESAIVNYPEMDSKPLYLCSMSFHTDILQQRKYNCFGLSTNRTERVEVSNLLTIEDCTFTFLHLSIIIGLMSYATWKLRQIKLVQKHIHVSNALTKPPFWQFMIPGISLESKCNFKLWNGVWLITVHIFLYAVLLLSSFAPDYWPKSNGEGFLSFVGDYDGYEKRLFISSFFVIALNATLTGYKIYSYSYHEETLKIEPKFDSPSLKLLRAAVALIISMLTVLFVTLYIIFFFPEAFSFAKKIIFGSGTVVYGFLLFSHLLRKSVYINNKLYNFVTKSYVSNIDADWELETTSLFGESRPNLSATVYIMLILPSWIATAIWRTTLMILAFHTGEIAERLFSSTLINILLNTDYITTYSYVASIIGIFYKFTTDIEAPFYRLRSILVQERGILDMERIVELNEDLKHSKVSQMKEDLLLFKNLYYLIPMTWLEFAKISKMVNIVHLTKKTLLQMLVTLFVLCVFFMAAKTHDSNIFERMNDNIIIGLVAGTIMPLIPKIVSYFNESAVYEDEQMFTERVKAALLVLERKEERNNKIPFDWDIPSQYTPFRYVLLSVIKESESVNRSLSQTHTRSSATGINISPALSSIQQKSTAVEIQLVDVKKAE
jgi:hypothetical protein